ncbi:MAG: molybdate ABC transporter substrate-binding protein [Pseudomonadota bacterium]
MSVHIQALIITFAALFFLLCANAARAGETAHVAVASNFKSAMDALETAFEEQSGHELVVTAGSTGKLYAQIVNGAPFDVLLAADEARPRRLLEGGLVHSDAVFTYATGKLVLWDPAGRAVGPDRLQGGAFRRLALANPDLAPYGAAARDVLPALGVSGLPRRKQVMGENIGQTFAFVKTQNADLGFVALSQILSLPPEKRGAYWAPPDTLYTPIHQDAALLARADGNSAAFDFFEYLKSDDAAAVIRRFGYEREES